MPATPRKLAVQGLTALGPAMTATAGVSPSPAVRSAGPIPAGQAAATTPLNDSPVEKSTAAATQTAPSTPLPGLDGAAPVTRGSSTTQATLTLRVELSLRHRWFVPARGPGRTTTDGSAPYRGGGAEPSTNSRAARSLRGPRAARPTPATTPLPFAADLAGAAAGPERLSGPAAIHHAGRWVCPRCGGFHSTGWCPPSRLHVRDGGTS